MNIKYLIAILTIGVITSCSTTAPHAEIMAATADEPCFHRGTIYSNGAASCQSGMQYRCDNGEWVSLGDSCREAPVLASRQCQFSGVTFPTGAASCQSGSQYRCEDGSWRNIGVACSGGESPMRVVPGGRTCMLEGGNTVSTSSSVCRSGSTYLCSDGEWINLGTLCR
ncbi:MAG: hypothetical protein ABSB19_08360 [Methylomonas sp.]|jgi:hypothetical protein